MRAGLRDELLSERLEVELASLRDRADVEKLDPAEASGRLARYLAVVAERTLAGLPQAERQNHQVELVNRLIAELDPDEQLVTPGQVLLGIRGPESSSLTAPAALPPRPTIPLSSSDLLFNGAGQPSIGNELRLELASTDHVALICAFVIWSGVRTLQERLREVIERGGQIRVITTTYMGATEPKALNELVDLGADVKVAFDARITKLHAKSWMLDRPGGLSTAFIGSSNLSHTALHDGLEWNVRLSQADAPHLIDRMRATFETYWEDDHFERYEAGRQEDLEKALGANKGRREGVDSVSFYGLDVHPYPYQRRILEQLAVERERHDRHRNLVVAATGTGKTVLAALDYRSLVRAAGRDLSLLFVAHREQILSQSRSAFRAVMKDGSFGEILGGGRMPADGRHVFAMIQSLRSEAIEALDPGRFDVLVVDEFHHAAAPSYSRLLERLEPKELLGLTATPERMDGGDVTEWFGGRIAVELRLWEAIDQGFLAPFQYFGVADDVDLSQLQWRRGGYVLSDLNNVLTGDDIRVSKLVQAIRRIVDDPQQMKALGFCVSVEHATYMADKFRQAGLPSAALSGDSSLEERRNALGALERGELRAVFSVDVLGEGVDVPTVDTVLLLRPTQSATVLTQQLGRGLRRAEGKRCLTVIDLIGQQHREFRFDHRLRALVDPRLGPVRVQAEAGFPLLPTGCEISLDRASGEIIMDNLRQAARLTRWGTMVQELRDGDDRGLAEFLEEGARRPVDIYKPAKGGWTALRREAGRPTPAPGGEEEKRLLRAVGRLLHVDDAERTSFFRSVLEAAGPPLVSAFDPRQRRLLAMLHFSLWGTTSGMDSFDAGFQALWKYEAVRAELLGLLDVLDRSSETVGRPLGLAPYISLQAHVLYSRDEVLAALGVGTPQKPPQLREGVKWIEEERVDALFVTLNKSERDYSPTTMYRDYAISPELFHWESQSTTRQDSATGQRYVNHASQDSHVLLFVRETAKGEAGTEPYLCAGPVQYVGHEGERPMAITWRLRTPMPEVMFESARAISAG